MAISLRLYLNMNQFNASLWGDEGFSAILSMKSIPQIIKIIATDTSPPLYNLTEHIAFRIFGTEEIVIRGLSFFYYLLTCFFIFLITKLIWDKKTALLATALTFFNPFFFIYAFEGRMYSIMALGVAASFYFFLKLLVLSKTKIKKPWKYIAGLTLGLDWALYSHHFAIFAVFVLGFWFVIEILKRNWKFAKWTLISFIAAAILYSPWLVPLYNQTKMVGGGFWLGTPTLTDLRTLIYEYLATGIKYQNLQQYALYLVLLTLAIRKWHKNMHKNLILLTWFLGPIFMAWIVSQAFQSVFYNRYLLYTIPGAMILLSSNRRKIISIVFIAIILGLFVRIDWHYFNNPTKLPFQDLAAYVKETRRGDDFLINWDAGSHHLWETKYYKIPAPIYIGQEGGELPFFVGTALMEEEDIIRTLPDANRIGVVTSGNVEEVVLPGYTKKEVKAFGNLKFIWLSQ